MSVPEYLQTFAFRIGTSSVKLKSMYECTKNDALHEILMTEPCGDL